MNASIPPTFGKILQCLEQEKDTSISWTLSKAYNGEFSLKLWTKSLPVKDEIAAKIPTNGKVTSLRPAVQSTPASHVNLDKSPDSVDSIRVIGEVNSYWK